MRQIIAVLVSLLATGGLWASEGVGALQVDAQASYIRFISVKKSSVAEVGEFKQFTGEVSGDGSLKLAIDLGSVDTAIDIRDQRLRDELFEIVTFPQATVAGKIDLPAVQALAPGQELALTVDVTLSLHAVQQPVQAQLLAVRLADGSLRVATVDPILLSLEELGLAGGVQKLQELAGLVSIDLVVPVYFSLVLR
jgi:polyisoprenoid-binding protein YceI